MTATRWQATGKRRWQATGQTYQDGQGDGPAVTC